MSAIAADRPRHTFPLKIVLVGTVVMVGKVELDSTLPTVPKACRRSSLTLEKSVSICLRHNADWSPIVIGDFADSFRSCGNQA